MRRARSVPGRGLGLQMAEQRTRNTPHISVTREVSQLRSGWLKACAHCRGSQAGHTVRGGLRGGVHAQRSQGVSARKTCPSCS